MRWKLLGVAVFALGAIAFSLQWRNEIRESHLQKTSRLDEKETTGLTSDSGVTYAEALQYKSRLRPNHRRPTREETAELLRTTTIPVVHIEDNISIRGALVELNRLASEAGIPPEQLKFVRGASEISPDEFFEWRLDGLAVRNIPLASVLKYLIDNRRIRYRVGEGFIEFRDSHELLDQREKASSGILEKNPSGSPDPFAP